MRYGQGAVRRFRKAGTIAALTGAVTGAAALATTPAPAAQPSARPTSDITITVTGLRSSEGVVRACITSNPDQFPKCRGDAASISIVKPAAATVTLTFHDIKAGRYAVALLHDENNNGKADRAFMMMPKEGFGFSRDAKVKMGPPKFDEAAFDVTGGAMKQTIRMRYML